MIRKAEAAVRRRRARKQTPGSPLASLSTLLEDLHTGKEAFNPQDDCPLFVIPAEIRNAIFSYVVKEQDGKTEVKSTDYWYRPDFTHYRYIETALLRTCRLIWLETHALPRQHITRRFWAGGFDRRPKRLEYAASEGALAILGEEVAVSRQILPCETAQVFIQMFALERLYDLNTILRDLESGVPLRHLIITIRYTDWWFWEHNVPLRIENNWTRSIRLPDSIKKLTMELETRQGKKPELDAIVNKQLSWWKFPVGKEELVLSSAPPQCRNHIGTNRPGGLAYSHHGVVHNPPPTGSRAPTKDEMYYYTVCVDYVRQ